MACLTIVVDSTFITLVETQLIALIVLSSCRRVKKKNEGERTSERESDGRGNVNARGRSQLALRFGQRANERNKARAIKITVAVV